MMSALRLRLDELMAGLIAKPLTRPNAIALLTALVECLDPALAEKRNIFMSDLTLHLEHAAIGQLNQLIDSLRDLDNGKVDEALKPSTHQANAALTIRQRKEDQLWLEMVAIIQGRKRLKYREQAERAVAEMLNKAGKTRRGRRITGPMLKKLRQHLKKI
jgi:hypothetical protein